MTDLDDILRTIVGPGLALLPAGADTRQARVMLLAIGLQESKLEHRWQVVDLDRPEVRGPARGLWQFERGGGAKGVLTHPTSAGWARDICEERGVSTDYRAVWEALAEDDLLACAFARLLLLTDPKPLPKVPDAALSWDYYNRNWRPGKPHPAKWPRYYAMAASAVPVDRFHNVRSAVSSTETPA